MAAPVLNPQSQTQTTPIPGAFVDAKIKLLLLGDSTVGKTCILNTYAGNTNEWDPKTLTTIGIDMQKKITKVDGKTVALSIWDTAGQERFRSIVPSTYSGAHGVILVYDITNKSSFDNVRVWFNHIHIHAKGNLCKLLVGNKSDLADQRVIETHEGQDLAEEYGVEFLETSAKTGTNVDEAFEILTSAVLSHGMGNTNADDTVVVTTTNHDNGQCCIGDKDTCSL
eukprot:TRINITY_DN3706_c0_g1_i3.p2 TRINITY_DN3706_c0_g1~~TRINITY_DN3706_c0_g1_i3.p2  ORF type:complete len:225 (-),score=30.35 TRINITY_DN3706_c0_g1_i3:748-1422(-)